MFSYQYNYCDHLDYINDLAKSFGVPVTNNTILIPSSIGTGFIKAVELANGLQVLINEGSICVDVSFKRKPATDSSYTLRFDQVNNLKVLSMQIDEDKIDSDELIFSGAFLTNSLQGFSFTASAGTEDRGVNIYFTEEWLKNYAGISSNDEAFKKYLSLKTATLTFEVLNFEYRSLMEDIFEIDAIYPMQKVILQNRVMMLIEIFFRNLYNKMNEADTANNALDEHTIKKIMQVESILVSNVFVAPPTIPQLARTATMSETKLKNIFKKVYGYSLYEYYQKNRMLKARQMLKSKKYSIKETGMSLGFKNLSNFTIAYKKEFKVLPSEIKFDN